MSKSSPNTRRRFLQQSAFVTAAMTTPGLFAEELTRTPPVGEGPFYPDKLPVDQDNDLLVINDSITPAVGTITHLSGRVLSANGSPVKNVTVEIWQCDAKGAYIHSRSANRNNNDKNFQGYGKFETDKAGQYYFRTIKPVAYPGRTPHIHFIVKTPTRRLLTTQMFIQGHPQNAKDGLFRRVKAEQAKALEAKFTPKPESKMGEELAKFDIVLGQTFNEDTIQPR